CGAAFQAASGRREPCTTTAVRALAAYAVPLAFAAALVGYCYAISTIRYPQLAGVLHDKHVSNMGQVYVFGHLQRHPDWKVNPWIGWEPIMRDHFGTPKP